MVKKKSRRKRGGNSELSDITSQVKDEEELKITSRVKPEKKTRTLRGTSYLQIS